MVSRRLSGWGTARSTSYRRLKGSLCDSECAPRSTCTFPSALGVGYGPRQSKVPTPNPPPLYSPAPASRPLTRPPGNALRSIPTARPPGSRRTRVCHSPAPRPCKAVGGTWPLCRPGSGRGAAPLGMGKKRVRTKGMPAAQPSDAVSTPQAALPHSDLEFHPWIPTPQCRKLRCLGAWEG